MRSLSQSIEVRHTPLKVLPGLVDSWMIVCVPLAHKISIQISVGTWKTYHRWIWPLAGQIQVLELLLLQVCISAFRPSPDHGEETHETLPETRGRLLRLVAPALHFLPPRPKLVQPVLARELAQQLHRHDGADPGQAIRVVAAQEVCEADELVAVQTKLALEVGEEEALDGLGLVEHVLEHAPAAEEEHVRVVRDDPIDEPE